MTKQLGDVSERLDIELLDHFIVGKEGVYSFAKEGHDGITFNQEYQDVLKNDFKSDNKQMKLDLER